jgi:hypothetical protein
MSASGLTPITPLRGSCCASGLRHIAAAVLAIALALGNSSFSWCEAPAAAASTRGSSSHGKVPVETVTIEAKRKRKEAERAVSRFMLAVPIHYLDDSLARWNTPICPLVAGLPREQGEFVLTRLSQIVTAAKAPLAGEHCKPNLYVVMTREPDALLKKWYARDRYLFVNHNGLGYAKRFLNNTRPVRVWYNAEFVSAENRDLSPTAGSAALIGTGLGTALQDASVPTNIIGNATRLSRSAVLSLSSVIVVVDAGQVKDLNFGQLADYIGMIGLAEVNLDADLGSMPTILRLFRNIPDPPQRLSDWDQAFLSSLYSANQASAAQEATMMRIMLSSIAPQEK